MLNGATMAPVVMTTVGNVGPAEAYVQRGEPIFVFLLVSLIMVFG